MTTSTEADLLRGATEEIESLHRFFVDWFTGAVADDAALFEERFSARFDPEFVLIAPAGHMLALDELSQGVRSTYGTNPDFRIQIRNVTVRLHTQDLALVTYEEWQKAAKKTTPPNNARVGSALFRRSSRGLRWFHLQETTLPPVRVTADPFDFDQ